AGVLVKVGADSNTQAISSSVSLCALVVDALLGTGTCGELRDNLLGIVNLVNESAKPVFALDAPTGLCVDTGRVLGAAIKADITLTFLAQKPGLLTGQAADYVGELYCDALGLEQEMLDAFVHTQSAKPIESFCFEQIKNLLLP